MAGTQGAKFEINYRTYTGFHGKKEIFLKAVTQTENYAYKKVHGMQMVCLSCTQYRMNKIIPENR